MTKTERRFEMEIFKTNFFVLCFSLLLSAEAIGTPLTGPGIEVFPIQFKEYVREFPGPEILKVKHTADFEITGRGIAANWAKAEWTDLPQREDSGVIYKTKVKMLYSDSGIYCLYHCEDNKIVATLSEDFLDLWNEDVVEAFFWTDENVPLYFEYELSPRNFELPILIPNINGDFMGWRPFHYEAGRRTRHATYIDKKGGAVVSWSAEFFIPYSLLKPMTNIPPKKGSLWRANFYRIDYDKKQTTWTWQPVRETNFHDYQRFGKLQFD